MPKRVLVRSFYNPSRGGRAPGDLRAAFEEAAEAFLLWDEGEPQPKVEVRGEQVPIIRLCGLLWNCTDLVSRYVRMSFDGFGEELRPGASYAQVARRLRYRIQRELLSDRARAPAKRRE